MGMRIEFNQEMREFSTMGGHVPNPQWSHTDAAGHVHRFEGNLIPTVEWVVTATFWCPDCREDHDEGEYRCRECGQRVDPGYNWEGPQTVSRPGRVTITLHQDGQSAEITEKEANALYEAARLGGRLGDEAMESLARTFILAKNGST